ncbi:MAG TPA: hypothetical protein VMW10_04865 [Alphaproteobacteria bacterium]|nr:hypothetical protein [Alphaproteobacteria bacterium]
MTQDFDLEEWASKGEDAYNKLVEKVDELEERLKIAKKEKISLARVLGKDVASKRPKIRPAILALLEESGETGIAISEICAKLLEGNSSLNDRSIKAALERVVNDFENVVVDGDLVKSVSK